MTRRVTFLFGDSNTSLNSPVISKDKELFQDIVDTSISVRKNDVASTINKGFSKSRTHSENSNISKSTRLLRQVPKMSDVDEFIMLLHVAAEIEHSLMVQYLYSAYSLPKSNPKKLNWRSRLLQIAKEEMGHMISIQNILYALGAPLNFDREDYPFNILYPFSFTLEPFSVSACAKYVLAEMPDKDLIPHNVGFNYEELKKMPEYQIERLIGWALYLT